MGRKGNGYEETSTTKEREGKKRDRIENKGRENDIGNYVKSQIEHFSTLLLYGVNESQVKFIIIML